MATIKSTSRKTRSARRAVSRPITAPAPRTTSARKTSSVDDAREEAAYALGVHAYLWGFPLAEYGRTLPEALKVGGVGCNTFRKFTALKSAKDRFVVTPNNVTIDAYCAFDVSDEPVVVTVPKLAGDRWYIVQLGDHGATRVSGHAALGLSRAWSYVRATQGADSRAGAARGS